ncbi:MAG: methyltransferase domain-containing protein [Bacteroidales bacterium]
MNLITIEDFKEAAYKLKLRGFRFILSKFNFQSKNRTISAFNQTDIETANYWDIPKIKNHWNNLISGDENCGYEDFVVSEYLSDRFNLKMLSIGCGGGHHELRFAKYPNFSSITGIDIAPLLIAKANKISEEQGFTNLNYKVADFYKLEANNQEYDVVHFYASLHHFKPTAQILEKVKKILKKDGYLIVHEYVGANRFQFPGHQIYAINDLLQKIPEKFRIKYKSQQVKTKFVVPGLITMFLADPSEAADSESIRPNLKKLFSTVYEAELGGNLLQLLFKDIAHHFVQTTDETSKILTDVFEAEKVYIENKSSDLIFGIYQNK